MKAPLSPDSMLQDSLDGLDRDSLELKMIMLGIAANTMPTYLIVSGSIEAKFKSRSSFLAFVPG